MKLPIIIIYMFAGFRKIFTLIFLVLYVQGQLQKTREFWTENNWQIYLIENNSLYYYITLSGDDKKVTIEANLYVNQNKATVNASTGHWVGVGFGKNKMENSEMVMFMYSGGKFSCADAWAPGYSIQMDKDIGGTENMTFVSGTITDLDSTFSPFMSVLKWTCTKDISNVDKNDWADFKNWQTNKGEIIGAYGGYSANGLPQQHSAISATNLRIQDGAGSTLTAPTVTVSASNISVSYMFLAFFVILNFIF